MVDKKKLSILEKNQLRAKTIVKNFAKERKDHLKKRIDQYTELKMIKGWSREEAEKMAKELILDKHNYD